MTIYHPYKYHVISECLPFPSLTPALPGKNAGARHRWKKFAPLKTRIKTSLTETHQTYYISFEYIPKRLSKQQIFFSPHVLRPSWSVVTVPPSLTQIGRAHLAAAAATARVTATTNAAPPPLLIPTAPLHNLVSHRQMSPVPSFSGIFCAGTETTRSHRKSLLLLWAQMFNFSSGIRKLNPLQKSILLLSKCTKKVPGSVSMEFCAIKLLEFPCDIR